LTFVGVIDASSKLVVSDPTLHGLGAGRHGKHSEEAFVQVEKPGLIFQAVALAETEVFAGEWV